MVNLGVHVEVWGTAMVSEHQLVERRDCVSVSCSKEKNMNPLDKTNKAKQIRTYFTGNWLLLVHSTYLSGSYIWIDLTLLIHSQRTMKPMI